MKRRVVIEWGIPIVFGLIVGVVIGVFDLDERISAVVDTPVAAWRWSDGLTAACAVPLAVSAVTVFVASLNPKVLSAMLKIEGVATPREVAQFRKQGVVLLGSALLIVLPPALIALGLSPWQIVALMGVLFIAHSVLNVGTWFDADEMFRRLSAQTSAITFWIGLVGLFLWAVAERVGLLPALTSWDVFAVLFTVYIVVSVVLSTRRGLS